MLILLQLHTTLQPEHPLLVLDIVPFMSKLAILSPPAAPNLPFVYPTYTFSLKGGKKKKDMKYM